MLEELRQRGAARRQARKKELEKKTAEERAKAEKEEADRLIRLGFRRPGEQGSQDVSSDSEDEEEDMGLRVVMCPVPRAQVEADADDLGGPLKDDEYGLAMQEKNKDGQDGLKDCVEEVAKLDKDQAEYESRQWETILNQGCERGLCAEAMRWLIQEWKKMDAEDSGGEEGEEEEEEGL